MTNAVSGDALTALVEQWRKEATADEDRGYAAALEDCADELAALIAAGRSAAAPQCDVLWANHNRCVKPAGHTGPHLTDSGFDWQAPAPAPLPAPRCVWKEEPNGEYWESACGETWTFIDGNPSENKARFCHGCGKPIQAIGVMEQIDAEEEPAPAPAPLPAPTLHGYEPFLSKETTDGLFLVTIEKAILPDSANFSHDPLGPLAALLAETASTIRGPAPAPLPAPTQGKDYNDPATWAKAVPLGGQLWTGQMSGFAPADMDFSTTNSGDVGGPSELPRPR